MPQANGSRVSQPCGLNTNGEAAERRTTFDCSVRFQSIAGSFCVLTKKLSARPEALKLKILEQFIQLKDVADGVHDSVLQH